MNDIPTPQNQSAARRRMRTVIAIAAAAVLVGGAITAGALFRASDPPSLSAEATIGDHTSVHSGSCPQMGAGPGVVD